MKLSQMSTDRALDALCELTPHISNIAGDEAVRGTVGKAMERSEELNLYGKALLLVERMGEIIPSLLKSHRADVYGILSVLNEKTPAEIAAQPALDTMRQVKEAFQDEDLVAFFKSSAQQEKTAPSAPSAASPAFE